VAHIITLLCKGTLIIILSLTWNSIKWSLVIHTFHGKKYKISSQTIEIKYIGCVSYNCGQINKNHESCGQKYNIVTTCEKVSNYYFRYNDCARYRWLI